MGNKAHIHTVALLIFALSTAMQAQHNAHEEDFHPWRIAGVLSHTYIQTEGADEHIFIPSWGLDLDYWFDYRWGIGLHNDIEIESFIVETNRGRRIDRVNPLVFTVDALYHIGNGLVVEIGPGIEVERNQGFFLIRLGLEYEYPINDCIYLMPTLFYDHRIDGFSTTTLGLGLGYNF